MVSSVTKPHGGAQRTQNKKNPSARNTELSKVPSVKPEVGICVGQNIAFPALPAAGTSA